MQNTLEAIISTAQAADTLCWTSPSRDAALKAAHFLIEEKWRLNAGAYPSLRRWLSRRSARIGYYLRELHRLEARLAEIRTGGQGRTQEGGCCIRAFETKLLETQNGLNEFLRTQGIRIPYEDLAVRLYAMSEREPHPAVAAAYRQMLSQLEWGLDEGAYDQASPQERTRDQAILEGVLLRHAA